jgi:hypothetical protein
MLYFNYVVLKVKSRLWMHSPIQICLVQSYSKVKYVPFNRQILYILFLHSKFLGLVGQVVPSLSRLSSPPLPPHLLILFRSLHLLLETRCPAGSYNSPSQKSGPLSAFTEPELNFFAVLKNPFC